MFHSSMKILRQCRLFSGLLTIKSEPTSRFFRPFIIFIRVRFHSNLLQEKEIQGLLWFSIQHFNPPRRLIPPPECLGVRVISFISLIAILTCVSRFMTDWYLSLIIYYQFDQFRSYGESIYPSKLEIKKKCKRMLYQV
jgi:hypothetical protein